MATEAVVDTSVAVRWFLDQNGSAEARDLLRRNHDRSISLVLPWLCLAETIAVIEHKAGVEAARKALIALADLSLHLAVPEDGLLEDALIECAGLGCRLYDALPAATARQRGATLYSADRRAHGRCENVVLLG